MEKIVIVRARVKMSCNPNGQTTRRIAKVTLGSILAIAVGLLSACGNNAKLETCKFVEIEDAEFEVEFGDVDVEGGEVEMVCGDKIIDVAWSEFRNKLKIDPGQYKQDLEAFKRQVTCMKDDNKKDLFCNGPGSSDEFVKLNFSYDD